MVHFRHGPLAQSPCRDWLSPPTIRPSTLPADSAFSAAGVAEDRVRWERGGAPGLSQRSQSSEAEDAAETRCQIARANELWIGATSTAVNTSPTTSGPVKYIAERPAAEMLRKSRRTSRRRLQVLLHRPGRVARTHPFRARPYGPRSEPRAAVRHRQEVTSGPE